MKTKEAKIYCHEFLKAQGRIDLKLFLQLISFETLKRGSEIEKKCQKKIHGQRVYHISRNITNN